jgi:Leucine-rich repeat (LRR) protein
MTLISYPKDLVDRNYNKISSDKNIIHKKEHQCDFWRKCNQPSQSIEDLNRVRELRIGSNSLIILPEFNGQFTHLDKLFASFNQLTTLPQTIGNLSNLSELYLSFNDLNILPESLGNLLKLTKLDLSYNQLTTLPETIGNLKNLEVLWIMGNNFSQEEVQKVKQQLPNCIIKYR